MFTLQKKLYRAWEGNIRLLLAIQVIKYLLLLHEDINEKMTNCSVLSQVCIHLLLKIRPASVNQLKANYGRIYGKLFQSNNLQLRATLHIV